MERDGERGSRSNKAKRDGNRKKSHGSSVAALCASHAVAVAMSRPRVCADGSHGPLYRACKC